MKQQSREIRNTERSKEGPEVKGIGKPIKGGKHGKQRRDEQQLERIKTDKKGLAKTLETVQKSTASSGKFDKKLKNEKEINHLKKKKVDTSVLLSRKHERERNKSVLETILGKKPSTK